MVEFQQGRLDFLEGGTASEQNMVGADASHEFVQLPPVAAAEARLQSDVLSGFQKSLCVR